MDGPREPLSHGAAAFLVVGVGLLLATQALLRLRALREPARWRLLAIAAVVAVEAAPATCRHLGRRPGPSRA